MTKKEFNNIIDLTGEQPTPDDLIFQKNQEKEEEPFFNKDFLKR